VCEYLRYPLRETVSVKPASFSWWRGAAQLSRE
jgi:hypothetical protein